MFVPQEVTLEDWLLFRQLGASVSALEAALSLYAKAGKDVDQGIALATCPGPHR
jgi:hypothetical protein